MKQKNSYLFIVFMLLLALVLVACGGGDTEAPAESSGGEETAAEETAVEPVEEEEAMEDDGPKIFTMLEPRDPLDIDPRTNYDGVGLMVLGQTYETLTHYNPPGSDPEISPELATSWEASDDAMEWTFELREGVTFHDGEPFNAEAVKNLVENVRDGDFATSWVFGPIVDIEVIDDHTIKFTNEYPAKLDLIFSSAFGAWMTSPAGLENGAEWFQAGNSAGTGPYKITSREPGTRIVMSRHEDYWGGWSDGQFDSVVLEAVADPAVQEQMLRSGEASLVRAPDWDNLDSLEGDDVSIKIEGSYENQFFMLNNAKPPLDNPIVRQALVASFPYDDVLGNLRGGRGTPAGGAVPQSMWGASPNVAQAQDLEQAAALLAEAGIEEGTELDMWISDGDVFEEQVAELWTPILRDLGITLNVTTIDANALLEAFWADPAEAMHISALFWFPTYVTPFDPLFSPFSTGEYFNTAAYDNEDFTNLLFEADAVTATDLDGAIALYQQANQMIIDDAAAVFVMDMPVIWLMDEAYDGYYYSPAYGSVVRAYNLNR
ncbi:MAG: ABC transporter substrate-binding protein [Chloroflexota bacterium]